MKIFNIKEILFCTTYKFRIINFIKKLKYKYYNN